MRKIMAVIALAALLMSVSAPALAQDTDRTASSDHSADQYVAKYKSAILNNALSMNRKAQSGHIGFGRSMEHQVYSPKYWDELYMNGRQYWKVKAGIDEARAIRDVFDANGGYYKIDCAAAINLIVLKSKLDTIGDEKFNKHFYNLIVKGWELHTQPDGKDWKEDKSLEIQKGSEYHLGNVDDLEVGDYVYYKNPNPFVQGRAEQGENALYLGKDSEGYPTFFGLNIGIFKGKICQYGFLTSVRGSIDAQALKKMAES
jgi:protein-glutamine gamma-glutamyltransferase